MRTRFLLTLLAAALPVAAAAQASSCTGLCLQQVSCPNGGTTSVSGIVYAPNGTDPLPDVTVYVPNAAVAAFTPGVSCPVVGTPPSGSPLVGTTTAADGTFTIPDMPVGTGIPLVIVTGRWRRQFTINVTNSCGSNPVTGIDMPQDQTQGDIPKIAVNTASADSVECVLRKVGISDSEFTVPDGGGRINLFWASGSHGAAPPLTATTTTVPTEDDLLGNSDEVSNYDVLMVPCEGGEHDKPATELTNFVNFANQGGRVYSSHYAYEWMIDNPPFNAVVNWNGKSSNSMDTGTGTVVTDFEQGNILSQWMNDIGLSTTTPAQIAVNTIRTDFSSVNPPTQPWLTLNSTGNPVLQFVFDTPVGNVGNQCGRVLFNEYHVENPTLTTAQLQGLTFPAECSGGAMTPQEKLLEYSLFALTAEGNAATLTPASADFGSQAIGFTAGPQIFTWTNNSIFTAAVTLVTASGDYTATSRGCNAVPAGGSCTISVTFAPTALGTRTGVLTVGAAGTTLTSQLTGVGTPGLVLLGSSLAFGNHDIGSSTTLSLQLQNQAPGALPFPPFATTGDYAVGTSCPANIPAGTTCAVNIIFTPTTTGARPGTLAVASTNAIYSGLTATFTGNGVDFTVALSPTSGNVIAGLSTTSTLTATPVAGFSAQVNFSCTTTAPGGSCSANPVGVALSAASMAQVQFTTVARYSVIGYGGVAGGRWFGLLAAISGLLLLLRRRRTPSMPMRALLVALFALSVASFATGCSGKVPTQNSNYTPPGTYTYTVSATDGFLVHSATYSLTVTSK
jgi:hypothetical protein